VRNVAMEVEIRGEDVRLEARIVGSSGDAPQLRIGHSAIQEHAISNEHLAVFPAIAFRVFISVFPNCVRCKFVSILARE
jgi:hypothetical protein